MEATASPRASAIALIALAVGVPVTILIPIVGWLYGWKGVAVMVGLGIIPAYLFGFWMARRGHSAHVLWSALSSTLPFTLAVLGIVTHAGDPSGWFWLCAAALTFLAALIGARTNRSQSAT